jgi:hypothetical protein
MTTVTFKNGNTYKGDLNRYDKPHGYGILNYKDEVIYEGNFVNNRFEGKGKMKWIKDNQEYTGTFKNNLKHGNGTMYYSNGTVYDGEWKNDNIYGKGIMKYEDETQYEGIWKDKFTGKGIIYYTDGTIYEGEWSGELREPNGEGKMTYTSMNATYEGSWKNALKHGYGIVYLGDEKTFEGEWVDDKKNGRGTTIYDNGDIYDGEWKNDNIYGKGTFTSNTGNTIYKGIWKNEHDGQGTIQYTSNFMGQKQIDLYEGTWKKLVKDGKGKMTYRNNQIYVGGWKDNQYYGLGRMYYPKIGVYDGHWENNKRHGNGQFTYINKNIIFYGKWKKDKKYYGNLKLLLEPIKTRSEDTHYGVLKLRSPGIKVVDKYIYPSVSLKCKWNMESLKIDTIRSVTYDPPFLRGNISINIRDLFDFISSSTNYLKLDFYTLCGYTQSKEEYETFIDKMKTYKGTVRLLALCHGELLVEQHIPCPVARISSVENGLCAFTKLPNIIQSIDTSLEPIKTDGTFKYKQGDYVKTIEDEMEYMLVDICLEQHFRKDHPFTEFLKSRKTAKCNVKTLPTRRFTTRRKEKEEQEDADDSDSDSSRTSGRTRSTTRGRTSRRTRSTTSRRTSGRTSRGIRRTSSRNSSRTSSRTSGRLSFVTNDSDADDEQDETLEWKYASSKDISKRNSENEKMFNKNFLIKGLDFNVLFLIDEEGNYINLFRKHSDVIQLFDILHLIRNCAQCIFIDFSCSYSNLDKEQLQKYGGFKKKLK